MRKGVFSLFVPLIFLLVSCASVYQAGDILNTDPPKYFSDEYPPQPTPLEDGSETETDYTQITAASVQESYPLSAECFTVHIDNPSGKPFYFFFTSYLEKKSGSTWERLNHQPESLHSGFSWMLALSGFITLDVCPQDVRQRLTVGEYRFVVFVGNEVLFAPFTLTRK